MLAVPEIGLLNRLLPGSPLNIYSLTGLVWAFSLAYLPILLSALWRRYAVDGSFFRRSRAGLGGFTASRVSQNHLTLSPPDDWIGIAALLLATMSAFGLPAMLGAPARIQVLTTNIFTAAKMGGMNGIDEAFAMSLWLILTTLVLVFANDFLRRRYQQRLTAGKAARPSVVQLGAWRLPVSSC